MAMSRDSERSVLSEKFHCKGSCEVTTISSTKSCWISARVCSQDGPVHTVAGSTKASRPLPRRNFRRSGCHKRRLPTRP